MPNDTGLALERLQRRLEGLSVVRFEFFVVQHKNSSEATHTTASPRDSGNCEASQMLGKSSTTLHKLA